MDPFDILIEDHDEMYEYYDKYKSATDFETKKGWLDKIHWELARHASAEEIILYPLIQKHLAKGKFLVEMALTEHQTAKTNLVAFEKFFQWDRNEIDLNLFDKMVDKFMKELKEHNDEEETLQFPELKKKLSAEEMKQLAMELKAAKKKAPTHVHPNLPNKGMGASILQPAQGLLDKVYDAVVGRPSETVSSP